MREERIQRVLADLQAAAADSRKWLDVLQGIMSALQARRIVLGEFDRTTGEHWVVESLGYDASEIRQYINEYLPLNPWLRRIYDGNTPQVTAGESAVDKTQLQETRFYSEWLEPQGLCHEMCAVVLEENEKTSYLEVLRGDEEGPFQRPDIQCVESIVPACQVAIRRNKYLWDLSVALSVLECIPMAVLAVDALGRCHFANSSACELLKEDFGISLQGNTLVATAPTTSSRLSQLIARAADAHRKNRGSEEGGTVIVRRRRSLSPLRVVVRPLGRPLRRVVGQEPNIALVFICAAELLGKVSDTVLRTAYHLTPAEQRLTSIILRGSRVEQAARELGISCNTARTHLKHVFTKTGVTSQTELIRAMLVGPDGGMLDSHEVSVSNE